MKKNAGHILLEASETFKQRNVIYKDNFLNVGAILSEVFPDGLTLNDKDSFTRFQMIQMIVGKLTRYVANWDKGGHQDSIHDLTVYAAILESIDEHFAQPDKEDSCNITPQKGEVPKKFFGIDTDKCLPIKGHPFRNDKNGSDEMRYAKPPEHKPVGRCYQESLMKETKIETEQDCF
jgi:hypothetical protein